LHGTILIITIFGGGINFFLFSRKNLENNVSLNFYLTFDLLRDKNRFGWHHSIVKVSQIHRDVIFDCVAALLQG